MTGMDYPMRTRLNYVFEPHVWQGGVKICSPASPVHRKLTQFIRNWRLLFAHISPWEGTLGMLVLGFAQKPEWPSTITFPFPKGYSTAKACPLAG